MMDLNDYLKEINSISFTDIELEMHEYASRFDIPIIQDEGLAFLRHIVSIKNPKKILEIGTAIGFSAINMARFSNADIKTIEIDEKLYEIAKNNIKKANYQDRIEVILANALDVEFDLKFDMIFIDAAKAQYIKFFEKFQNNLSESGIVITDNLLFHGLVIEKIHNRNLRQLVEKIKKYNKWLMDNKDFVSYIYGIGDGIAISIKK